MSHDHHFHSTPMPRCTCCPQPRPAADGGRVNRRTFLGDAGILGGLVLSGLSWTTIAAAAEEEIPSCAPRRPLKVKPVLSYDTPARQPQTSWRGWGGIETQADAEAEVARIQDELAKLQAAADFPIEILPVAKGRNNEEIASAAEEIASADVVILYAAGGWSTLDFVGKTAKDVIFFCRHKSGPVYLWYEIISPRYLRQHTDTLKTQPYDDRDVVIDSQDELLWRLRSLCGLRNAIGTRILAVGGASGWCAPDAPKLAQDIWKLDIQTLPYEDLGKLIQAARADQAAVDRSRQRAEEYLKLPGTTLETERKFVDNAFLLEEVFRGVMKTTGCNMMTINSCMGTIMPMAETSACLTLSLLNDSGLPSFCESDFVVIPSGILLGNIAGRPVFLNDPTYPHDGIITLAHCTGPRRMDGKNIEPARILTHFESDYGAAPKVEMRKGQMTTNIVPAFDATRYVGVLGEIVEAPFLPICRDQIDIRFTCDSLLLAQRMPGFHWMTCYGDYSRELGYALKRTPIQWELLG